ncbi:unnamed protein product [Albugo candida]|nr:unnamed protein product [Albugo candida]|eukprot:CCI45463.1 unnamed protein product [Albugo candida]
MIQSREFKMAAASYCGNQIDTENADLEALLHTELDLPLESNFDEDSSSSDIVNVSLELLALQSPHGCTHQWDNNAISDTGECVKASERNANVEKTCVSSLSQRNRRSNSDSSQHVGSSRRRPQSTARKRKIKHGGIYSLLLNDPLSREQHQKCSPVLLENVSHAEMLTSIAGHTLFAQGR